MHPKLSDPANPPPREAFRQFFRNLTDNWPHPYQERLAESLVSGNSVILRAPTGSGKTWAVVAPFLFSLATRQPWADRLIYALPLRSLASGLHTTVYRAMRNSPKLFGPVRATGKDRDYNAPVRCCSLQFGGEAGDPFFESDLVFTTIDQLLSGYLFMPVSLPDRLGNIVAGSLPGSFLVFDEAHLLEPPSSLGTMIEMLDRLQGLCRFVIMTATMSDSGVHWLAQKLRAQPLLLSNDEVGELPGQTDKQRVWKWAGGALTADAIHRVHGAGRTIVLLNSVSRAQALFEQIERLLANGSTKLVLLHSRFYPEHRAAIETEIVDCFGPQPTRSDVILVTTQVIEAGIDISADHLHTELAPMNALIQRAGRVARYMNRNTGRVTLYHIDKPGPYRHELPLVNATREILSRLPPDGINVDWSLERQWIDKVHRATESARLSAYDSLRLRRSRVHEAMDRRDRGLLPELVRDADSINVLITEKPEDLNFSGRSEDGSRLGWPKMLGVPAVSLLKPLGAFFDNPVAGRSVAKAAQPSSTQDPGIRFDWVPVKSAGHLRVQWLVAIHPNCASYDSRLGLVLGHGGPPPLVEYAEMSPLPRYQYQFEPWTDHARRIKAQYLKLRSANRCAVSALAQRLSVPPEFIDDLTEIVCTLHDVGKLTAAWQERAWRWQRDKDERLMAKGGIAVSRSNVPIAHTSFDLQLDGGLRYQAQYRLPNHSVEGAFAVAESLIAHIVRRLEAHTGGMAALSALSAIAQHHAPGSRNPAPFRLSELAGQCATSCLPAGWNPFKLAECPDALTAKDFAENGVIQLSHEPHEPCWPLFVFLVRSLRLADQAATAAIQ